MSSVGTYPSVMPMHVGDVAWKGFDFGPLLQKDSAGATAVLLTGTPTITITPASSGLACTNVNVNSVPFYDADAEIPAIATGEGVIARFAATAAGKYTVKVEADTDNSGHLSLTTTIEVGP